MLLALCCLLSAVSFAQSEPPRDAKATLIFFREGHVTGSALKPSVYVDGKETIRLANGRWFCVEVEPGKHNLAAESEVTLKPIVRFTANLVKMLERKGILTHSEAAELLRDFNS